MAKEVAGTIDAAPARRNHDVFPNEDGALRWRAFEDGQAVIDDEETETTCGRRLTAGFMHLLPIRRQL